MKYVTKISPFLVCSIILILVGTTMDTYWRSFFLELLIWSLLATSFNILYGYCGLLSFGQSLFFGIGCYSFALTIIHWHFPIFLAVFFAIFVAILVGLITGLIVSKLTGHYFVITTVLLSLIPFYLANHFSWLTGGDDGIPVQLPKSFFGTLNISPYSEGDMFWVVAAIVLIAFSLCIILLRSPIALIFKAIKENELKAEFLGYDVRSYKLLAWVISGACAALSGCLYVLAFKYTSSTFFHWTLSGEAAVWSIFGGSGTIIGPVLGTFVFLTLKDFLSSNTVYYPLLVGSSLIFLIRFRSEGITGIISSFTSKLRFKLRKAPHFDSIQVNQGNLFPIAQEEILCIEELSLNYGTVNVLSKIGLRISNSRVVIEMATIDGKYNYVFENVIGVQSLSIIGPNGAGKTTLFNILSGAVLHFNGKVQFWGQNPYSFKKYLNWFRTPTFNIAKLGICRTFQSSQLFQGLTVEENFEIALLVKKLRRPTNKTKQEMSYQTQLDEIISLTGLGEERFKKVNAISYGRKKLIEIGLSICTGSRILLFDEPTAGVSNQEVGLIIQLLRKLSETHFLIVIEHDLEVVQNLQFITCVLANGEIIAAGDASKILQLSHVREKFYVS